MDIDLPRMREQLESRRLALLDVADSADEAASTVELDQTRVGRVSRIDALAQQAMSQETSRRRKLELNRIASALARIDAGEYGWCLKCG
ncbi:MAG: TraR/DksA family transcriptional regulator, partial [Gammaproteobacteria bacterium]